MHTKLLIDIHNSILLYLIVQLVNTHVILTESLGPTVSIKIKPQVSLVGKKYKWNIFTKYSLF